MHRRINYIQVKLAPPLHPQQTTWEAYLLHSAGALPNTRRSLTFLQTMYDIIKIRRFGYAE